MIELRYYQTGNGKSPFEEWFSGIDAQAAAKVTTALVRLEQGNFSNVKGVGAGVLDTGSIGDLATGFTSGEMVTCW